MSSIVVKLNAVAYYKGVESAKRNSRRPPECPYGETKQVLKAWWYAGLNDYKLGNWDRVMYEAGKPKGRNHETEEEQTD